MRCNAAIRRGTELVIMVLMTFLVIVVVASVIFRYVLMSPLSWSEEVCRYVMIWLGFLGASLAVHEGLHVGVEFVVDCVPPQFASGMRGMARAGVAMFLLAVMAYGFHLVTNLWDQMSPVLEIRMTWPYLAIPVGSLLMLLQLTTPAKSSRQPNG
jgi:TRAP-type C4-dicarboxylate transport system permease small subunit